LFSNSGAQDRVSRIEALCGNHPARNVVRAQQFACGGSEHAKAEPRQPVPGEVAIAG